MNTKSPINLVVVSAVAQGLVLRAFAAAQVCIPRLLLPFEGEGPEWCALVRPIAERLILRLSTRAIVIIFSFLKEHFVRGILRGSRLLLRFLCNWETDYQLTISSLLKSMSKCWESSPWQLPILFQFNNNINKMLSLYKIVRQLKIIYTSTKFSIWSKF